MKQHPRLRKAAKWGGLGLAGVSLALMAVSAVWSVVFALPSGNGVVIDSGSATLVWDSTAKTSSTDLFFAERRSPADDFETVLTEGLPIRPISGPGLWMWSVTLDLVAAAGFVIGVPALLLDRRARRRVLAGHCAKCGYDCSGIAAGVPCPECGAGGGRTA